MSLKINYLDRNKGLSKNKAFFVNSDIKINQLKQEFDKANSDKILNFIKNNKNLKENKITSLSQDFDQKLIVIYLVKINGELESEKLGANFYDYIKKNDIKDIFIKEPSTKNINFESFIHGSKLKSYQFNLYKTKKIKVL